MSRVNSSALWDFFEKTNIVNKKATCKICGDLFSYKTTTGNLKNHLKKRHIDAFRRVATQQRQNSGTSEQVTINTAPATISPGPIVENGIPVSASLTSAAATQQQPTASTSTAAVPSLPQVPHLDQQQQRTTSTSTAAVPSLPTVLRLGQQQSIERYSTPKKISKELKKKIDSDLIRLFTDGFQPFSLVEEKAFKNFVRWIPGYTLPTRKTISNVMLPALYDNTKAKVKSVIQQSSVVSVCLTTDMWTSRANEGYLAVTGHYIEEDFKLKSILLFCGSFPESHTSENVKDALSEMVAEWGLAEKINFVVSDNAPNITKAIRDNGWKHYGCFAHTLNNIMQDTIKSLAYILDKIKKIVRYFKTSSTALVKLLKAQTTENPNSIPKRLKQEVPTRWNSAYHMLQRFVELESHLRATMAILRHDFPVITNEEWTFCMELCKILKPFDDATNSMSGQNYMTASSVIVMARCLISSCDRLLAEEFCEASMNVVYQLRTGLISKFANIERSGTFSVCTFLDPRYKTTVFSDNNEARNTRKRVEDLLVVSISKEISSSSNQQTTSATSQSFDKFSPWSVLQEIVEQQRVVGTPTSKAIKEIDTYLNDDMLPVFNSNGSWNCPLEWWRNHKFTYPHLSKLFVKYGNIMATSVPCERIFSKTGQIISDRRTRLTSSKVEQLAFLNVNLDSV